MLPFSRFVYQAGVFALRASPVGAGAEGVRLGVPVGVSCATVDIEWLISVGVLSGECGIDDSGRRSLNPVVSPRT